MKNKFCSLLLYTLTFPGYKKLWICKAVLEGYIFSDIPKGKIWLNHWSAMCAFPAGCYCKLRESDPSKGMAGVSHVAEFDIDRCIQTHHRTAARKPSFT